MSKLFESAPRTRIAPSSSGFIHLGNAFNFLLTEEWAKDNHASLLLRIETPSPSRLRPEYVEDIYAVLDWLTISFEGPQNVDEFFKREQTENVDKKAFDLIVRKNLGFVCHCSRKETSCACEEKRLAFVPHRTSIKLKLPHSNQVIALWSKENVPSLYLSGLIQDLEQGVTQIIRGEDLRDFSSTQKHLAKALGSPYDNFLAVPITFHPNVVDSFGEKLSKSTLKAKNHERLKQTFGPAAALRDAFHDWKKSWARE